MTGSVVNGALALAETRSLFSKEVEDDVLRRIAEGESLRKIAGRRGYPSASTIVQHAGRDEAFGQLYRAAREAAVELHANDLLEIADDADEDVQRSRLRVDVRKWLLSKLLPGKYGDKVQLAGDGGGPIEVTWKPAR